MARRLAVALVALSACQSAAAPPPTAEPTSSTGPSTAPRASASARPPTATVELTAEHLMKHVEALCTKDMSGREAGTANERRAADYVTTELTAAGLEPKAQEFALPPDKQSLNVVVTVAGSGARAKEHVILGAHMDHLGVRGTDVYWGAEDNASGVAVLLDVAALLSRRRAELDRSVTVVFFGSEEVGLVGSRHFAANPTVSPMAAMINVDMIGRDLVDQAAFAALKPLFGINGRRSIGVIGTRDRPRFKELVMAAAKAEGMTALAPEDLPKTVGDMVEQASRGRGDNNSFEEVGVPSIFFGQGESDDYHQPTDTPDKLAPEGMAARGHVILRTAIAFSQADLTGVK